VCRTVRTLRALGGVVATLSIVLLTAGIGASSAQADPWPTPPDGVSYSGYGFGLGIDSSGNLYTSDYMESPGTITQIDPSASVIYSWAPDTIEFSSEWITVDDANNVITVGTGGTIVKYLKDGTLDPNFALGGVLTLDGNPAIWGVVTDHAGNIYTANSDGTVSKISPTGEITWTARLAATTCGESQTDACVPETYTVALDAQGNVYATDFDYSQNKSVSDNKLWKILPDGSLAGGVWPVTVGGSPNTPTVDASGNIYVPNFDDGTVSKVLPDGTLAGGPWPVNVGGGPGLVTIDAAGSLYVTNWVNNFDPSNSGYVSKILSDGTLVEDGWPQATGGSSDPDYSGDPWGAVIDSSGNLFVNNYGPGTVTKFAGAAAPAPPIALDAAPSAVAGVESATVTITPNAVTAQHGTPTSYTITTVEDASKTCTITMPATSCVVDHLTGGKVYTFTAKANLVTWQTGASAASTAVTPTATPVVVMKATPLVITLKDNQVGAQSNSVTISFTADGPGSASLNGSTGGQRASNGSVKICSAKKTVKKAGKVTMTCTLNNKGKALRTQHALHVVLTLTFTPTGGTTTSATKNATFARTKATKPKPSTTPSNVTG